MRPASAATAALLLAGLAGSGCGSAGAPPAAVSAEARLRITLSWTTSTEVDNYGFFVFRGDAESGPFREVNERILPGAGNSEIPRRYTWEDFDVVPGRTYFYYLESVSTAGVREKFSPVISKTCCKGVVKAD